MNTEKNTITKVKEINNKITSKYNELDKTENKVILSIKQSKDLFFRQMSKLMEKEIKNVTRGKGIIGVDGSINTVGSSFPHYISVMKGLAKCTNREFDDVILADVHTPLLQDEEFLFIDENLSPVDRDEKIKAAKMAKLELEAAYEAIKQMDASLVMMDGSLIRYKINCGELWDNFVNLALAKNIYVIGVIEEIKTKDLQKILGGFNDPLKDIYDREILFGKLEVGDMITIKDIKEGRGLKKCFMRTSNDPHVIGMDVLEEQQHMINDLADLVYTLTAEGGRGIPLWLDIVDNEVKITKKYVEALIDAHIDPAIKKRFFSAKRDFRSL